MRNFIIFIGIIFLVVMALPLIGAGIAMLMVFGGLFIWFLPILFIVASDETTTGEKTAWILAIIFLSWFAWIFYFLLAPIKPRNRRYY
jgi:hypothetical protein